MWQGKSLVVALSLGLLSACSVQTVPAAIPVASVPKEVTANYAVYFAFDSAKIDADAGATVSSALTAAKNAQAVRILLSGYADRAGSAEHNLQLSKRRVDAVAAAFVDAGISPGTIDITARGEEDPQTPTLDGQAEAANRRVEIALISRAVVREPEAPATPKASPDSCTAMPVYIAGTRLLSCVTPFQQFRARQAQ